MVDIYNLCLNSKFKFLLSSSEPNLLLTYYSKKMQVGDIEIAYKMLGKGDHILLFNGGSDVMDAWDPSL